jgi:GNAT superfamily N-acetyltransferase
VTELAVSLRAFAREDLAIVEPWFRDAETRRYLGGHEWSALMLERDDRIVGEEFRGAVQTGAYRYVARCDERAFGYVDCGTFDRRTVYGGEGPDGPILTESTDVATGSIAFVVDPAVRRRRMGRAMINELMRQPELGFVKLFEGAVEPENAASRRCLEGTGCLLRLEQPDCEGMLYYRVWRAEVERNAKLPA